MAPLAIKRGLTQGSRKRLRGTLGKIKDLRLGAKAKLRYEKACGLFFAWLDRLGFAVPTSGEDLEDRLCVLVRFGRKVNPSPWRLTF